MYTLEEINKEANAKGWRAFRVWLFVWLVIMALFILFAAANNPDLHWYEIALDESRIFKYETLTHTGEVALKGNGKEYSNIIYNLILNIFEVNSKEQTKLLKKRL